ncbi:reelin-like [Dysidea avara]|uniref:reelin-like n=1 Tax=Dysidea avara TaxID=196820 RepID=UPI003333CA61
MSGLQRAAAGYDLRSSCSPIASGNSIVFSGSVDRYLISQSINATDAVALQFVFGNEECGSNSDLSIVYLEYIVGGVSYLLTELSFSTNLYSVHLPVHACTEGTQISWTQADGFTNNTGVWQLDNVVMLYAKKLEATLLDTFTNHMSSSPVLFYPGGSIQDNVCSINDKQLLFTGSSGSPSEYVLTPPFSFGSNSQSEVCSAPCLCGPGGYSDDFDSASYR